MKPATRASSTWAGMQPLEDRRMLSVGVTPANEQTRSVAAASVAPAVNQIALLTESQIRTILSQAASQAMNTQAIVVVDREGFILGIFAMKNATNETINEAAARARTAAFFQSKQECFTTRTARFIIQDRFPNDVPNTAGGPLYGVEFSSLRGTDMLSAEQTPGISGDPGGIPLYVNGLPVGGIGVAGDGHDIAARKDFLPTLGRHTADNPNREFYTDHEERDFDEAIALAGAQGFMAPDSIQATEVFLDGLRLPFTFDQPATGRRKRSLDALFSAGAGELRDPTDFLITTTVNAAVADAHPKATFAAVDGQIMNPIVDSNDSGQHLTARDVKLIIHDAVRRANITRAAIRLPIGTPAVVHVAVVDRDGDVVGVFRMNDGTRFSYDVAVQKARTAAFFSDDTHAISTRAIGFLSQGFFPPGIQNAGHGPLFHLQNQLSASDTTDANGNGDTLEVPNFKGPLKNGITIFPGGVPLYKNGVLVGAVGVSGDGVDQDDTIAYSGTLRYRPTKPIRSDQLSEPRILSRLTDRFDYLAANYSLSANLKHVIRTRLHRGFDDVRLPYVKLPRNPDV